MAEKIITGIDIGTYHVKVAVAKLPNQPNGGVLKPEIIGTGMAESRGLKNGYIIHPEDVARSGKAAVAQAEKTAGQPIKRACRNRQYWVRGNLLPRRNYPSTC